MTFTKITTAVSVALFLGATSVSFAADGTTLGGGANTQMKGGANKTESGMDKGAPMKSEAMAPKSDTPGAATTLAGKTKTN